jgi:RNA polymerase sigma-70 factor (ECF subfamily)
VEGSVSGLLFRLARNIAISEHRHLQTEARVATIVADSQPGHCDIDQLPDDELRQILEREISALPPRRREVFLLRVVHDLSYKEIAAIMGTSSQTVANQLSSALTTLRQRITRPEP